MLTIQDRALLKKSALFHDLNDNELQNALTFFDASTQSFARGETLKHPLDPLPAFGLVLEGSVSVAMDSIDGREMLLSQVTQGQTFGEAICYLQEISPVRITASENARILCLRCDKLKSSSAPEYQRRFTAMLCARTLRMNDRIQILSRTGIREKLTAFFTECARDAGANAFTIPFDRNGMAAYLGIDRSALSRALSQMQKEGLIRYHKNCFEML